MPIIKKNGEIIYPAVRRGKNMKEETEALIRETDVMVQTGSGDEQKIPEDEQKIPEDCGEQLLKNLKRLDADIHDQNLFEDMTDRWGTPVMCDLENKIETAGGAEEYYIGLLQEWIELAQEAGNKKMAETIREYLAGRGEEE